MNRPLVDPTPTIARINVTPIIDVALVLVIILLITAPMIASSDMNIDLPSAHTRSVNDEVRLSITMGKNGEVAIDDQLVARAGLARALSARIAEKGDENILVVVRADAGTPHHMVRGILEEARAAGAQRIAIAARQRGRRSP